ncbi:TPA: ABC transporter substrate-binding protein [Pseudomonas aeruginosa]
MTIPFNPFLRGYHDLRVFRTLLITCDESCPPVWRPLHPSQSSLRDEEIARAHCWVGAEFALIAAERMPSVTLRAQCTSIGIVQSVIYAVTARSPSGQHEFVGDNYSKEDANEVVRRLAFETGHFSRCWEISTAHLDDSSYRYLADRVDQGGQPGMLFVAFRIPFSPALGLKLIGTPWTDEHLAHLEEGSAEHLRLQHSRDGMPEALTEALHLAAQADVRMLVFDADAPLLEGLPVYEEC